MRLVFSPIANLWAVVGRRTSWLHIVVHAVSALSTYLFALQPSRLDIKSRQTSHSGRAEALHREGCLGGQEASREQAHSFAPAAKFMFLR
jgi:hypothetical protein